MVCAIFIPVLHQRCFKVSPLITIALCFARLLEAALPALQVFVVGYLIAGRSGSSLTLWELIFLVVVSAMLATKSAGSAYGELMASAPIALRYLKLRNTLSSIAEGECDNQDATAPQSKTTLLECEQVDLADHVKGLPGGLDTQLGEQWDGTDLSGGQWQRLALARTLLSDAKLLVLDEPTSSVDAESESKLFHMLKSETLKRSVLLVSHRAWTLCYADKIYLLDHGNLAQLGACHGYG